MNIVFFGSFQHYSAYILKSLIQDDRINVVAAFTTPPTLVGRKKILTPNPVQTLAEQNNIPVFTPHSLTNDRGSQLNFQRTDMSSDSADDASTAKLLVSEVLKNIPKPDFFITAGYGKILPKTWLEYPKHTSLNLHFSLLPAYRGANPAEWAIMCGEKKTGITLMKMNEGLDTGDIIAQEEIDITDTDTRETIYQKLYTLGAEKLPDWLTNLKTLGPWRAQASFTGPYAALLKRQDGFIPWPILRGESSQSYELPSKNLQKAHKFYLSNILSSDLPAGGQGIAKSWMEFVHRLPRALAGFPTLWTIVPTTKGDKRMKILSFDSTLNTSHLTLYQVQLEGQQPAIFNQIKNQII